MNNDYFTLQHSTDGMEFRDLGKIASQGSNGSSATPLTYSFIDQNPVAGHNYYRLMQTDLDQNQTQHAQVVDLIWGDNGSLVSIFPNPTNSVINVDLFVEKNQNTRIHVLDMSGRIVVQVKGQATKGNNHFQLDLSELAEGVYTVQVFENNTLTHVSKINKMN
jgi:S-adenosylmethionine:tRNA-ribosyltransferase-isomerase (queuine synthetase)